MCVTAYREKSDYMSGKKQITKPSEENWVKGTVTSSYTIKYSSKIGRDGENTILILFQLRKC